MLPFDLEKAKRGHPLVCRGGTEVRFLMHVPDAQASQRVIYIARSGCVYAGYENGNYQSFGQSPLDLMLKGEPLVPEIDFYSLWLKTSNHVEYGREVERIVREQCAKEKDDD